MSSTNAADVRARLDDILGDLITADAARGSRVLSAARYALAGGGKRVRGRLVLEAFAACGGRGDASRLAAGVEVIHAYSLVHDDLPCMDDDSLRRGRATTHCAFDVASATYAGLVLVPLAAQCIVGGCDDLGLSWRTTQEMLARLTSAAGCDGMIGGQYLDIVGVPTTATLAQVDRIHSLKTGALMSAAAELGAMAAGASGSAVSALGLFGARVGLAFQIADDLLDVTSSPEHTGKSTGRDAALGKQTYPALLGVDGARARATMVIEEALSGVGQASLRTPGLEALARQTVERST